MAREKKGIFNRFLQLANLPDDSEALRRSKENLMLMSTHFTFVSLAWGTIFAVNGLWKTSYIPFFYTILSAIDIGFMVLTKNFKFFRNTQLFLVLILPFLIQLSLGGFIPSSGAILWSIVSPMAALFFINNRQAAFWFGGFVLLIVAAYILGDRFAHYQPSDITDTFVDNLFLLNMIGVSGLVFLVQMYFANNERTLKKEVEIQNELLEVQSDQLKELDKMKSNFFANLSHEFRTPLTLIQGILNKTDSPSKEERRTMQRNADQLLELINQLLDLTKLESRKMPLHKQTIDLLDLTKKTAQLFGSAAEMKDIQFQLNGVPITAPQSASILAELDAQQMQKVLNNLIANAIKFCPQGGKIDADLSEQGEEVILKIANTGEDIPEAELQQIFNRFYQVDSDATRAYEGTGIGLSLVHEIISLHEGQIEASSQHQIVSFVLYLPKGKIGAPATLEIKEQAINLPQASPKSQNNSTDSDKIKILVVEDYPDLRQFISSILQNEYQVLEAANGEEGVTLALEETPDLIISDIMMPKKDGNQLCAELKNHPATDHIPIILLTARAGKEDKIEGLEMGADDYLTKPFDESELRVRVKNLLKTRKKLQQKYQQEIWLKPKAVQVTSSQEKFLQQFKEAVETHLSNEQLSTEDLANMMHLSRSQLHRKLKALTNQSITEFVRIYRLERGAELLKQDFGNISQIAFEVGFNSQTYFSSSFQNHFGCSPTEYKKT